MRYEEFKEMVKREFMSYLPEKYHHMQMEISTVNKVNKTVDAVTFLDRSKDFSASPTVYINDMYERFLDAEDYELVFREMAEEIEEAFKYVSVTILLMATDKKELDSMTETVQTIGAGGIASGEHIPGYAKMENVQIVALCDVNRDKAEKLAKEYCIPYVCEHYKEVFEIPELDAVDICAPNYLHSLIAVEALEHSLHVFCEKPDAVSVTEVMKMKDAAEKSGKVLMVMRNNRYMPISLFLKILEYHICSVRFSYS